MLERLLLASVALFLCHGCVSQEVKAQNNTDKVSESVLEVGQGVPAIVLDGTDLYDLQSFALRPVTAQTQGSYYAEQGGSEISLTISRHNAGWQIIRSYREPGSKVQETRYSTSLKAGFLSSEEGEVFLYRTNEGVIVLERYADVIPADYWVHYLRAD